MPTALVLDIDGTVCPRSGSSPYGPVVEVGVALRRVLVAPGLCAALADLGGLPHVVPVWLTTWPPGTRQALRAPFPGHGWEQLDVVGGHDVGPWPKWAALSAWLARHSQITRVAWVDDDLEPDRAGPCLAELRGRGIEAVAIAPVAEQAMTPGQVSDLERFVTAGR